MLQTALTNFRTLSFAFVMVAMLMVGVMAPVHEASAQVPSESSLLNQIQQLLQLVNELQQQLEVQRGGSEATPPSTAAYSCIELTRSMYLGSNDASTAGQVGKLQRFLQNTGHYTYSEVTGYFGPATQQAVQRWQSANGVVSNGTPDTTGFGLVGSKTRAAMSLGCEVEIEPVVSVTSVSSDKNPVVKGSAYNTKKVGFSIGNGDKVYGSGEISVKDNKWSHRVQTDLQTGSYTLTVYLDNSKVASKSFSVRNNVDDSIRDDIADLEDELEEYGERYQDMISEASKYNVDGEVEDLLTKISRYINEAEEQYDDKDYGYAEDNIDQADDLLDELNDILDDLEDGRYTQVVAVNVCPYTWTRTLKKGDTGADVKILQQFLSTDSYTRVTLRGSGSVNNENTVFDQATADAVSKFQLKYRSEVLSPLGLVNPTGELDASTRAKLNAVCAYGKTDDTNSMLQEQIDHLLEIIDNPSNSPSDSERKSASEEELQTMLNNLMQQIVQQQEEAAELVGDTESRDFWDIEYPTHVYTVGAYEGSYPDGDRHSFRYHPQGEVTINMNKRSGQSEDTMLILTSYEPVNWKLTGDATEYVTRVFLSGYYDQEITGIGSDVEVVHLSHQSGDRDYFYAYDEGSANFRDLREYVEDQSDEEIYLYWASDYSLSTVNLGQKG
jgi:peptidoglycan hydrolase-like protein with peptidoglycan-binding domain